MIDVLQVTKNMTWTYSAEVSRLYVMLNSQCPFKVGTTRPPPDNSYIVVIPVYKDAVSILCKATYDFSASLPSFSVKML